ncbi:MAG: hypothetical protein ACI8XC_003707 [Gammaproteobacteria bacterium]
MSNWILYDEFVDRVRELHHAKFSGLITGVSDKQHSFQIGFDQGKIILLTYRIRKGLAALELMTGIEHAKISEHINSDIAETDGTVPDTSLILSHLTSSAHDDTIVMGNPMRIEDIAPITARDSPKPANKPEIDAKLKATIEAAAIHHFGPIGAMVCEERLSDGESNIKTIMMQIAEDVGASENDTRAFFETVSSE